MQLLLSDSITLSRPWKHYARSLSIVIGESVKHWVSRCPSFSNFSIPRSCTNVFLHCFSICWWIPWRLFEKNRISIFLIIRSVERKLFLPISSCWWTMITPCSSMNCRNSVICIIMKIIWSVKYVFDHSYAIGWIRSMFMDCSSFCLLWRKKITRHSSIQPFSRSFRIILSMFVYCLSIYGNNVIVPPLVLSFICLDKDTLQYINNDEFFKILHKDTEYEIRELTKSYECQKIMYLCFDSACLIG